MQDSKSHPQARVLQTMWLYGCIEGLKEHSTEVGPLSTSTTTTTDGQGASGLLGCACFYPLGTAKNRKTMIKTYQDLSKEV